MIAKPRQMVILKSDDKDSFVKKFNSSLPNKELNESLKKAGELFNVDKETHK